MVGLVKTSYRQAPCLAAFRKLRFAMFAMGLTALNAFLIPDLAHGQAQSVSSAVGWGKATSEQTPRPVQVKRFYRPDHLQPAVRDRLGDQKASTVAGSIRPAANFQEQSEARNPVAPEVRIRNSQRGDRKSETTVFRDSNLRPVVNSVVSMPQEIRAIPPIAEPAPGVLAPSTVPQYIEPSTYQNEVVPYYYKPTHNGACSCPDCSRNRSPNWISLETLAWWTSDVSTPPLVTTSPAGTAPNLAGVAGPNSDVLFGGEDLFGFPQGGFRARLGHWNDVDEISGFEMEYLMLFSKGDNFYGRSDGNLILARPFTNVAGGLPAGGIPDAQLLAYPGLNRGTISVNAETRMYGVGARYLHEIYLDRKQSDDCGEVFGERVDDNPNSKVYLTLGPRFYHLDDTIEIREEFTSTASGREYLLVDSFKTENSFLGGEIGLKARRRRGRWQTDLGVGLGIGTTHQELDISGYSRVRSANSGAEYANGFLAQPTNIGNYEDNVFSLVPRLEFDLEWEFADGWSASVGYNLLYWTNVLRAGEQIDGTVNADLLPPPIAGGTGANRPTATLNESDYLAHGISFGIERRF